MTQKIDSKKLPMANFLSEIFAAVADRDGNDKLLFEIFAEISAENAHLRTKISNLEKMLEEEKLKYEESLGHFQRMSRKWTAEITQLKNQRAEYINNNAQLSMKINKLSEDIDQLCSQNTKLSGKCLLTPTPSLLEIAYAVAVVRCGTFLVLTPSVFFIFLELNLFLQVC